MDLKPCPFCASRNIAIMREGKSDKNAAYRVVCRECKTRGPKFHVQPWHDTKFVAQGQAGAAWNKRPGEVGMTVEEIMKLDRSRWAGCRYCADDACPSLDWQFGLDHIMPGYKFCPMCGRPITEKAWAELERRLTAPEPNDPLTLNELREMDGDPVWVSGLDGEACGCWDIFEWIDGEMYFNVCMETPDLELYNQRNTCGELTGWCTYRRKPEEGKQ